MELQTLIKAGYPLLSVKTQEPLRFLLEAAKTANGRRVVQWDALRGWQEIGRQGWEELDPYSVPSTAAEMPNSVWLLKNYHFFIREPQVIQAIQNALPIYKAQGITLIIISPGLELPPELEREVRTLTFDLPGREDLAAILDALATGQGIEATADREQIIDNLQGLTMEEAENALAWTLVKCKRFDPITIGTVKGQMVEKSAGLTFSTFKENLETLAGAGNMKAWSLNRFQRRRAGLPFRGMLILGAPGNGKSHFAKALGNAVNWRTVSLDLGRIFGGLVGASEENMERALSIIDAIAPCILFIDEIEKALSGSGGGGGSDGGTSVRVGAKFLTWLQDHTSEVFVIATCNDIKGLAAASDGAFVRAGRWDATFFVDNPTQETGSEILDIYLKEFTGKALKDFGSVPDIRGYSGAEIRQIAIETAYNGGDLEAAREFVIPLSKSNKDKIDALRQWAAGRTVPANLPEETATGRNIQL
jgi:SpoVK/Ycf46/Vps4 family AAA+-type ATPase